VKESFFLVSLSNRGFCQDGSGTERRTCRLPVTTPEKHRACASSVPLRRSHARSQCPRNNENKSLPKREPRLAGVVSGTSTRRTVAGLFAFCNAFCDMHCTTREDSKVSMIAVSLRACPKLTLVCAMTIPSIANDDCSARLFTYA
jgi:hypothetical protein